MNIQTWETSWRLCRNEDVWNVLTCLAVLSLLTYLQVYKVCNVPSAFGFRSETRMRVQTKRKKSLNWSTVEWWMIYRISWRKTQPHALLFIPRPVKLWEFARWNSNFACAKTRGLLSRILPCYFTVLQFVCVGTEWGIIHLLDHQGNNVNRELRAHTVAINQISIDGNGDHIASCSDDGRVSLACVFTKQRTSWCCIMSLFIIEISTHAFLCCGFIFIKILILN